MKKDKNLSQVFGYFLSSIFTVTENKRHNYYKFQKRKSTIQKKLTF